MVNFSDAMKAFKEGSEERNFCILDGKLKELPTPVLPHYDEDKMMVEFFYELPELFEPLEDEDFPREPDADYVRERVETQEGLKEQWEKYRVKQSRDTLVNWLVAYGIEVSGMPTKEYKVEETGRKAVLDYMAETDDLEDIPSPRLCSQCKAENGFRTRYFSLNHLIENKKDEGDVEALMKGLGIGKHWIYSTDEKTFIFYGQCGKCGSDDVIFDY